MSCPYTPDERFVLVPPEHTDTEVSPPRPTLLDRILNMISLPKSGTARWCRLFGVDTGKRPMPLTQEQLDKMFAQQRPPNPWEMDEDENENNDA